MDEIVSTARLAALSLVYAPKDLALDPGILHKHPMVLAALSPHPEVLDALLALTDRESADPELPAASIATVRRLALARCAHPEDIAPQHLSYAHAKNPATSAELLEAFSHSKDPRMVLTTLLNPSLPATRVLEIVTDPSIPIPQLLTTWLGRMADRGLTTDTTNSTSHTLLCHTNTVQLVETHPDVIHALADHCLDDTTPSAVADALLDSLDDLSEISSRSRDAVLRRSSLSARGHHVQAPLPISCPVWLRRERSRLRELLDGRPPTIFMASAALDERIVAATLGIPRLDGLLARCDPLLLLGSLAYRTSRRHNPPALAHALDQYPEGAALVAADPPTHALVSAISPVPIALSWGMAARFTPTSDSIRAGATQLRVHRAVRAQLVGSSPTWSSSAAHRAFLDMVDGWGPVASRQLVQAASTAQRLGSAAR